MPGGTVSVPQNELEQRKPAEAEKFRMQPFRHPAPNYFKSVMIKDVLNHAWRVEELGCLKQKFVK